MNKYTDGQAPEHHMFEIQLGPAGAVTMSGRLDATQCEAALEFLDGLAAQADPRVIDLSRLEYIQVLDCGCSCSRRSAASKRGRASG